MTQIINTSHADLVLHHRMNTYKKIIMSSKMPDPFIKAALVALPKDTKDKRNFWVGACGQRLDGAVVYSANGSTEYSSPSFTRFHKQAKNHAEGRLIRKMDSGIIYVSRISRLDSSFAMARPCGMCQVLVRSRNISKVFYSINNFEYGIWSPKTDQDRVFRV